MASANDWKPSNLIIQEPRDKSLSGGTFTAYMIRVDPGITVDKPGKWFMIAGPSYPSLNDLWSMFTPLPEQEMGRMIEPFINFLRQHGFVELEASISIGLQQ